MNAEIAVIEKILILIQNYRFESAVVLSLSVFLLWKTKTPIRALVTIMQIVQGKKTLNDLLWVIGPTSQMYGTTRLAFIFDEKIIPRDCNDLKMKLVGLLQKCRQRQEAITISFAHIKQISPAAIQALELFIHQICDKYPDIVIKIICPKKGQCIEFDRFAGWARAQMISKNVQSVDMITDSRTDEQDTHA